MKQFKELLLSIIVFVIMVAVLLMGAWVFYMLLSSEPPPPTKQIEVFQLVAVNLTNESNTNTHGSGSMVFFFGSASYDAQQRIQQYYQFYILTNGGAILRKLPADIVYIVESNAVPNYTCATTKDILGEVITATHTLTVPIGSIKRGYQLNILKGIN